MNNENSNTRRRTELEIAQDTENPHYYGEEVIVTRTVIGSFRAETYWWQDPYDQYYPEWKRTGMALYKGDQCLFDVQYNEAHNLLAALKPCLEVLETRLAAELESE